MAVHKGRRGGGRERTKPVGRKERGGGGTKTVVLPGITVGYMRLFRTALNRPPQEPRSCA